MQLIQAQLQLLSVKNKTSATRQARSQAHITFRVQVFHSGLGNFEASAFEEAVEYPMNLGLNFNFYSFSFPRGRGARTPGSKMARRSSARANIRCLGAAGRIPSTGRVSRIPNATLPGKITAPGSLLWKVFLDEV